MNHENDVLTKLYHPKLTEVPKLYTVKHNVHHHIT